MLDLLSVVCRFRVTTETLFALPDTQLLKGGSNVYSGSLVGKETLTSVKAYYL
jgi:hypothetical protein